MDSSQKKSSQKWYLQIIGNSCEKKNISMDNLSSACRNQYQRVEETLTYSEVAVSISSLCKLLKRTSYGYLMELASAICGINAGSSISWWKTKVQTMTFVLCKINRQNSTMTELTLSGHYKSFNFYIYTESMI